LTTGCKAEQKSIGKTRSFICGKPIYKDGLCVYHYVLLRSRLMERVKKTPPYRLMKALGLVENG